MSFLAVVALFNANAYSPSRILCENKRKIKNKPWLQEEYVRLPLRDLIRKTTKHYATTYCYINICIYEVASQWLKDCKY